VAIGQEEIGRRIAQARDEAGLNQRQLAELIGVADAQSISRYERGKTEVSQKRLRRIAEATGKPMSFFVREPDEPVELDLREEVVLLRERVDRMLALVLKALDLEEPPTESKRP
jgi:transcriptional regulator with XRE-family HTH domain